jgi:predicted transcriptional regulator of viral defense system
VKIERDYGKEGAAHADRRHERIEKGKYLTIPLGAKKGGYTINEFVIGSQLVKPAVIAYWSALNYHWFTEQIPNTVFIQTTARKKVIRI